MENDKIDIIREEMLKDYLSLQLIYVEYTSYIENKIKNILIENDIKYQALSSRVKSYDSLKRKLNKNMIDGICKDIKKLNDLSGVKVIFYDEKELKRFNEIIYCEFDVVSFKPPADIIKYDGINITISLKNDFNRFKGLLCELQLTTLLSHAMNEFGHNIIYKDIDELHSKNPKEYDKIKSIFENTRKDIYKIMATLEFINTRVSNIKTGAKNIELLLGEEFCEKIQNISSLVELETIINKMTSIIPIVNDDEDKYNRISDSNIIYLIVKKFSELPKETANFFNYDTYEYKYNVLLEFLHSYKYLWINDFKRIISILYDISVKNKIELKFEKFIENLIISDKVDSSKGIAYYNIHEIVYSMIFDKELADFIRIKMAEYFCDINYNYCEEIENNKISFINSKVNPNDNYKDKIYKTIEEILKIFFNNHSKEALHSLININNGLENNDSIFENNPIYDFFDVHYDEIDLYSKNELYKSVCMWKKSKMKKSNFYKKIKADKTQILYSMLVNYSIDEIPGSKYLEKESYRTNYLNNYIEDISENSIDELFLILNAIDKVSNSQINIYIWGNFFISIGMINGIGDKLFEKKWNEFLIIGIVNRNKKYDYLIDEEKSKKIVQAMIFTNKIELKIVDKIIKYSEANNLEQIEILLLKLILNNIELVNSKKYKKYSLKIIKKYNRINKGIMGEVFYNPHSEKKIIEEYTYDEVCILLNNFRYSEFKKLDEFFLNDLFEKYPEELRNLLKQKITDNTNYNLYNYYGYINLTKCKNFKNERYNNLKLCLELLNENNYHRISNYIYYLIGKNNKELRDDILKYLKENNEYDSYKKTIILCRLLEISIDGWEIYEYIISNIELNDKIINEIECLLFSTGVVSGEYGIANSFYKKYEFFNNIKSKKQKVKEFIKKQKNRFKLLYQEEKSNRDKDSIVSETKYTLQNTK